MLEAQSTVAAPRVRRPLWALEILLIGAFYVAYAWIRDEHGKVDEGSREQRSAYQHGRSILHLEHRLHLDPEHALQTLVPRNGIYTHAINGFYLLAHVTVTVCVLVFLWARRPEIYRRCRNALLIISFGALVIFALDPTAPPRLLPQSHIHDTLSVGGWWSLNHGGIERIADPYAAMPSLHLGWSTWCALSLALAFRGHWQRWLLAAYPMFVTWVVLSTGAHWFLDTVAGTLLALVGWTVSRHLRFGRATT